MNREKCNLCKNSGNAKNVQLLNNWWTTSNLFIRIQLVFRDVFVIFFFFILLFISSFDCCCCCLSHCLQLWCDGTWLWTSELLLLATKLPHTCRQRLHGQFTGNGSASLMPDFLRPAAPKVNLWRQTVQDFFWHRKLFLSPNQHCLSTEGRSADPTMENHPPASLFVDPPTELGERGCQASFIQANQYE